MSFTSDYYDALKDKKKKQKKKSSGNSFSDAYYEEVADIAPVPSEREAFSRYTDSVLSADDAFDRYVTNSQYAPIVIDPVNKAGNALKEKYQGDWIQSSGAFDDGYQFGDVTKAILGTGKDFGENLLTGIVGIGEKVVDAALYLAPYFAQGQYYQNGGGYNVQQDKLFEQTISAAKEGNAEIIKKDLYNEEEVAKKILGYTATGQALNAWGVEADDVSVLGEKSDALIQSAGQLAAQYGLSYVGVPWFVTAGATSFGSEAENALNQGASYEEAGLSATITAGAEILTEKLFGGDVFSKGSAIATDKLAMLISDKATRALVKFGLDATGEGFEEVVSQFVSNLGTKLYKEENLGEILFGEEALDEYIDSFAGGYILGGVMTGANMTYSAANGVDPVTGLTENEQKVVDKEYENRVAEKEQDGTKLTVKDKANIMEQVRNDLDKGYISTSAIEELLGMDSKARYDALQQEANEFNALYTMESGKLSRQQQVRLAELEAKNEANPYETALQEAKNNISNEVFQMVKDSRLAESYNEVARKSQKFTADLTKYDTKQQAVVQKAIDSGILNNTNRTHEFVDIIAKISADKGVPFDFTNNAKLKESGFALEGKTVNGFVTKDGITLNIDSPKAWQSTVGHEVTHVLEGTELYNTLQQTLFDYAKSKGEYDTRLANLTELYKSVKDADVQKELTADLVGDYLFTDSNFIKHLSTNNRNVFQKIYDEIKYLCNVATAGSKEARELLKVKKAFEDAYRADGKGLGETQYSISDKNIKDIHTGYAYDEYYYTMSYTQDGKDVATLEYGVYEGRPNVKMIQVDPEYRRKGIATKLLQELQKKYPDTEINFGMSTPDGSKLLDAITYDVTDEAVAADRQKLKDLQTELDDLEAKMGAFDELFDDGTITEAQRAEYEALGDRWDEVYRSINELAPTLRGKRATKTFVKTDTKYSISDSDGRQLSNEQAEYFKDSKARDAEGNLLVMYHGTNNPNFTVFDPQQSDDHISLFFTSDPDVANTYTLRQDYGRDVDPYNLITEDSSAEQFNAAQERVGGGLRVVKVTKDWIAQMKAKAEETKANYINQVSELADEIEVASRGDVAPFFDYHLKNIREELASGEVWGSRLSGSLRELQGHLSFLENRKLERSIYNKIIDTRKILDTARAYKDSVVGEEYVGQYVYTETNSMVPFTASGKTDSYFTHIIPGTEKEMVEKAMDRTKWVEEHNLGNRYKVYLNITNPYVIDASVTYSGKMDSVSLEGGYGDGWTVSFENDDIYETRYMKTSDFNRFVDTAFDAETSAKIKAQMEENNEAYRKDWPDFDFHPDDVYHKIQLEDVNIDYVEPSNWDNLLDREVADYFGWDEDTALKTRDVTEFAKAKGYDGVIFKNMKDAGGYAAYKGRGGSTVVTAFSSEQVKSVDNKVPTSDPDIRYSVSDAQNENGLDAKSEVTFSLSNDSKYMDKAIAKNNSSLTVDSGLMENARVIRERISARMNDIKDRGLVGLPEDIEGNTAFANSSYDVSEENTSICPRSLASEAFVDAVSEYLGRPLTVEEQIYISQDLQGRSLTPECTYCYVATDRKAYRAFLGEYVAQRDAVLQRVQENPNVDVSRNGELYKDFLNGRKDTNPMYSRFKMWVDAYKTGKPMIDASHLANINKLMGDINSEFGAELKPQIVDAMKYAQSASWAKKRVNYVAYNGHILNWKQDRINKLNSHYGLRMYSFSDFHPAFVLENMQMITDASVRGLKVLGYTKDTDFVDIFAPTGMNINVSTFGFESGGNVYENNIIGAEWEKAKALREQYPNVGVTFVATNDTLVEWALEQDWIDVVIPYHLVRTGAEVAKAFGYTNYTSESSDTKKAEWTKGDAKYIAPTEHNNDLATYLAALEKNNLNPRFERFIDNPNYMKLVNECRQPASESKPVQPVFNEEAAMRALAKLEANGYYQPIGGSVERMYEIAAEVAEDMTKELAPAMSLSNVDEQHTQYGDFSTPATDLRYEEPVQESAPVIEKPATNVTENSIAEFPDDLAPMSEDDSAERLASLTDAPPEAEDTYYGEEAPVAPRDPFEDRDFKEVGKRNVNAYMYDNPEVKPFFQMQAKAMLGDLQNSTKGEKLYNDELYYESGGEQGWVGVERQTTDDIAYLLDMGYTYAQIEKGLNAIIEDNGAENIAMAKRIEFALNDRLSKGYTDINGVEIPANQDYLNLLAQKETAEAIEGQTAPHTDADAPMDDIAPMGEIAPVAEKYEAIRPKREPSNEPRMVRADSKGKQRKWVGTSTESDAVDGKVLPDDLDQELIHYQPISNKKTLGNANARLNSMGYEASVSYLNGQFANNKVTLDDIALGERLIQEAVKRGDTKTAGDLIMDISILGTELGQKVQALSIIKRLTPEGQLRMLQRTVERGKTKGDKAFEGVEITQDMIDYILKTYGKDGTYDQAELNKRVEDVKQKIADQMDVTKMEKVNAWRYLSMLGNPKTHIRNLVSNVAMRGTVAVKNVIARTIESIAPIKNRTKTWKSASDAVNAFAQQTAIEMKDIISGDSKYSDSASIKDKRAIFKNKILNGVYEFNSDMLQKEDWWFSKPAFINSLSEFLTANGITTEADIKNNPKLVEKAKQYALEQSQIATFRQYSWLANKINEIERKNAATDIVVGSILPFKKTPVNIAKTGLNYSPLGFAKTLTYDISQVKKGNMEASELIDHLAQNITGTALTLVGYMLASAGFLNGAGDDDKEGDYDYQLGKQAYSVNIGDATFSLSWLSPVAMPLFVGANAYEQLVEGKEWNGDVVVETLAQTLDPLSEMSFISSLDSVLSSYDSGIQKFAGIGETMVQNYATQFVPTLSSQVAQVLDDKKRSTKVAGDSDFKFVDETVNKLMYKIPGLRNLLEPSTDIWGNEVKQTENFIERAFESFLAPYAKREDIATAVDEEIKDLYSQTGDTGVIPSIPTNYVSYDGEKYEMSADEYTAFKKTYGQTAFDLMEQLFDTETYRSADSETRADMVNRVYDYASDLARKNYFAKRGIRFTNATEDGIEVYKEDPIKGAIENDLPVDEYVFSTEYPEKYDFFKKNGIAYETYAAADEDGKRAYSWAYENPGKYTISKAISDDFLTYYQYKSDCNDFNAKDANGNSVSGLKKERVLNYINGLDLDYGQRIILFRSMYDSKDDCARYNGDILDYLNSRQDISYEDTVTILKELGFEVDSNGYVTW